MANTLGVFALLALAAGALLPGLSLGTALLLFAVFLGSGCIVAAVDKLRGAVERRADPD